MTLDELLQEIKSEFPTFKMVRKADSLMMKIINVFLKVITLGRASSFMDGFITTIGYTVYTNTDWDKMEELGKLIVIRHERVHMRQARKFTRPLFSFLYVFVFCPMILAYFRYKFEREAYEESMRALVEYRGTAAILTPKYREWIISQFIGASYGYTWPFRSSVEKWFQETSDRVVSEYVGKGKS